MLVSYLDCKCLSIFSLLLLLLLVRTEPQSDTPRWATHESLEWSQQHDKIFHLFQCRTSSKHVNQFTTFSQIISFDFILAADVQNKRVNPKQTLCRTWRDPLPNSLSKCSAVVFLVNELKSDKTLNTFYENGDSHAELRCNSTFIKHLTIITFIKQNYLSFLSS